MVKPQSKKCHHGPCKRIVKADNPTFPYCWQHVGLRDRKGKIKGVLAKMSDKAKDNFVKRPFKSLIDRNITVINDTARDAGINRKTAKNIINTVKKVKDLDNSDVAKNNESKINNKIVSILEKDPKVSQPEIVTAIGGKVYLPERYDGEPPRTFLVDKKEIVTYKNSDGERYIMDATGASVLPEDSWIGDYYESGTSTIDQEIYSAHIGDYGYFSSVKWGKIVDNDGKQLWADNISYDMESNETKTIRRMLSERPDTVLPESEGYKVSPKVDEPEDNVFYDTEEEEMFR